MFIYTQLYFRTLSNTSKFIPLAGTIIGGIMIIVDGFNDINFTLDSTAFWAFMGFTVGGSSAYGIFKRWKQK